jgi:hypothetical protein
MLDGTGLETRQEQTPSTTVKTSSGAHAASYSTDNNRVSFPGRRNFKLITYHHVECTELYLHVSAQFRGEVFGIRPTLSYFYCRYLNRRHNHETNK